MNRPEPDLNSALAYNALNKVCKWRMLFAGWQLGTRVKGDPESDAVRDMRELLIMLRVEVNTLSTLLAEKGVITTADFQKQLKIEAEMLDKEFEKRFPGFRSTEIGLEVFDVHKAAETQKGWKK